MTNGIDLASSNGWRKHACKQGSFWTPAIENTDNTACRNIQLLVDATVSLERLVTQTRKEEEQVPAP